MLRQPMIKRFLSDATPQSAQLLSVLERGIQIRAAALLQRNPVIMRHPSSFESAYEKYRELLQYETSRGVFCIADADRFASEATEQTVQKEARAAHDVEALLAETNALYEKNDANRTSLARLLDRKLYLVVQGASCEWRLPCVPIVEEQTAAHVVARRAVEGRIDPAAVEIYWIGHAPVAAIGETYKDRVAKPLGAKTFVFRGQLLQGRWTWRPDAEANAYAWLTKEEVEQCVMPAYLKGIAHLLSY